jgi:hypothetical protein
VRRALLLIAFAMSHLGCGADELEDHACPPGNTLTYETFGRGFFTVHCVSCHGGPNGYSSRSYTTVESIRADRERIFINAAGDNTTMPPGPDDPPVEARRKLADWLACGAP